jgi:PAS domain S-box-containing protein
LNQSDAIDAAYLWVGPQALDPELQRALEHGLSGNLHFSHDNVNALDSAIRKNWHGLIVDLSHSQYGDVLWLAMPQIFIAQDAGLVIVNTEQLARLLALNLPTNWLLQIDPVHPDVLIQNIRMLRNSYSRSAALNRDDKSIHAAQQADDQITLASKQTSETLRQTLDVALTGARLNHWRVNLKNNEIFLGALDEEFFGMRANSVEQLAGIVHPDDVTAFLELGRYGKIIEHGHYAVEYRVKKKMSQQWRWLSSFARHMKLPGDDADWIVGVTWDVTERKETEIALEAANQKLLAALNAANMIYFEWNTKTGERTAIGQQEKILGQMPDSISQAKSVMHPDDFVYDEQLIKHSLETGLPYQNQFRVLLPGGGFKWLQSYASASKDEQGELNKLSGICFDITERVNMLEQLQQSDLQLKRAVAAGKLISWEWRPSKGLKIGVGAFEEIVGVPSNEINGEKFNTLVHPDDVAHYRNAIKFAVENKTEYQSEYRLIRPDGEQRWMAANGMPVLNAEGEIEYIAGVAVDISAQKAAEQTINDSLSWLNLVVQAADINTYSIDLLDRTRKGGPLDEKMYGFSPATIEQLEALIHPEDRESGLEAITNAIINKKPYRIRYRVYRGLGEPQWEKARWHETMAMPEFNAYDRAVRISGVAYDVHERMEQTRALEQALQRAEKATKSKSDFLASMSHEIRTPMNAVVGVSELLAKSNLNQQQSDWVGTLLNSSTQLLEIINEILDFSRLDAGAMQLHPVEFRLSECIESSVSMVASSAAAKGLDLSVTYPAEMQQTVFADITRIRQVIVNLLSNAVKFTEVGGVQVNAHLHEQDQDTLLFELRVRDSGIGMTSETVSRLFLPFSQGDTTFTRRFGGTGLGLSICKQLCELMGGKISLSTEVGVGSEFSLRLPITKLHADTAELPKPLEDKVIALIGLNDHLASRLAKQIEYFGCKADCYHTAAEIDDKNVDTIDLVMLPQQWLMANDEATQDILKKIPCVMLQLYLTASEQPNFDRKLFKEALHYPYLPSQLLSAVHKSLGISPANVSIFEESVADPALENISRLRILVVEDNEINQYVLLAMLESIGCSATVASDGMQAVNEFETQQYDVVLMDVEMPVMDGIQATHAIRKHPHIKQPYVVALTAHVMPDSRSKFMQAGMNDYVSKPVLMEALIAVLINASQQNAIGKL